jgi:uncharacterized membrane protein YccC
MLRASRVCLYRRRKSSDLVKFTASVEEKISLASGCARTFPLEALRYRRANRGLCMLFERKSVLSFQTAFRRGWRGFLRLHLEPEAKGLAWGEGLRAAVGITLPAVVGLAFHHLSWGILCSFATLWMLSCDVGGAYRQKALGLAGSGLTMLVAYTLSGWMVQSVPNYVIGTFLWVFCGALAGVAGNAAAQAGLVSSTIVVTSVVLYVPGEFWGRLFLCLIGVIWALSLSLALWPLKPFSPLFRALSASCLKLANLADTFWIGAATQDRFATNFEFAAAYGALMDSLEQCRKIWGAVRARRGGPTMRSMQLLSLIEQVDDIARIIVTLREVVNLGAREKWLESARGSLLEFTKSLSGIFRESSEAVALRGRRNISLNELGNVFQKIDQSLRSDADVNSGRQEMERTVRHLITQVSNLVQVIEELQSGSPKVRQPPEARFAPKHQGKINPLNEIRNNLTFRSTSFRHALRLGVATGLGSLLASVFHLTRGYWIPMTVVLVLKPNFGGTLQRSVQRVTGTICGALLAVLILLFLKDSILLLPVLSILSFAAFTLRNRNYGLFALALTPMVMVMLDVAHPITVSDSLFRILYTIIGSLVALVSGYLFFPTWESRRLPVYIAEALRSEAAFARALRDAIQHIEERPISEFRRDAALKVSNAATAGQRLLGEPANRRGDVEAALATVNYIRGILLGLAAISDYPTRGTIHIESAEISSLLETLARAFVDLAEAVEKREEPPRLQAVSKLLSRLEKGSGEPLRRKLTASEMEIPMRISSDAEEWLVYHLANTFQLTLATREAISRVIRSERKLSLVEER